LGKKNRNFINEINSCIGSGKNNFFDLPEKLFFLKEKPKKEDVK